MPRLGAEDAHASAFAAARKDRAIRTARERADIVHRWHAMCVAAALKEVYRAKDADAAALDGFAEDRWRTKYPAIALSWRRHWPTVISFAPFPPTCGG